MANLQITAVRVQPAAGDAHEHIVAVRVGAFGSTTLPVTAVVRELADPHGDRFYTHAAAQYATVMVRRCPRCPSDAYLTTQPNGTSVNNLLSLPRF